MKFYVIEIQTNAETAGNLVYAYADRADAEEKYHQVAAAAAKSDVLVHTVVLLTREGTLVKSESYTHPAEA